MYNNETLKRWLSYATISDFKKVKARNLQKGDIIKLRVGIDYNTRAVMYWKIDSVETVNGLTTIYLQGITGEGAPIHKGVPYITVTKEASYTTKAPQNTLMDALILPDAEQNTDRHYPNIVRNTVPY
jgi:hypothetical protein